jgi:hypothetical protein
MSFQKDGPKRRRYTRRELPEGQRSQWGRKLDRAENARNAKLHPTVASNSDENNNERNW